MSAIQVAKLRLKCSASERERTRFAIEDSLRSAIPNDRRLVLVRKMRIAGQVSSLLPASRHAAVRDGWLAAISGARHGGDDGAADSNCVWFESRSEAEALLLSRLLRGQSVSAWYWRLALPDWCGVEPQTWVRRSLRAALAGGEDRRILAIARCFIAAGAVERLIALFADGGEIPVLAPVAVPPELRTARVSLDEESRAIELARSAAPSLVSAMPAELRGAIISFARNPGETRAVALAMIRAWVLKRSPALHLSPFLLAELVATMIEAVVSGPSVRLPALGNKEVLPSTPAPTSQTIADPAPRATEVSPDEAGEPPLAPTSAEVANSPPIARVPKPADPVEMSRPRHRIHSAHAGLWLIIPSMIDLGFREWLADRPNLLGENPAIELLHAIARHYRVPADDPVLAAVEAPRDADAPREWAQLWRHALDRWLRRTVRRRLHDLVNRPGSLDWGEMSLTVHYPAPDADIALRRRALDRDPGWVDWLGLSVRYHFGGVEDWL